MDSSVLTLVFFAGAALSAVLDWWAVRTDHERLEAVAKPLTMLWLIGAAAVIDADPTEARPWFIAGLALGMLGDVLLLPRVDRFVFGLGAFLLGHAAYIVGLATVGIEDRPLVVGLIAAGLGSIVLGLPVISAVKDTPLAMPVNLYIAVIATMAGMAYATQRPLLWIGAALFAISDVFVGRQRFVEARPDQRIYVHMLYHTGQALLVVGLAMT